MVARKPGLANRRTAAINRLPRNAKASFLRLYGALRARVGRSAGGRFRFRSRTRSGPSLTVTGAEVGSVVADVCSTRDPTGAGAGMSGEARDDRCVALQRPLVRILAEQTDRTGTEAHRQDEGVLVPRLRAVQALRAPRAGGGPPSGENGTCTWTEWLPWLRVWGKSTRV
jgi:hypothetical protein